MILEKDADAMDIMRTRFIAGFAGLLFEINTVSTCACVLCRNYLKDGVPDIRINVSADDINHEYDDKTSVRHNRVSAETTAVYRKLVDSIIDYETFLMHGAVVGVNGSAYMFSAPSGTGKTTHIKLWLNNLDGAIVVNGDKPLIRVIGDRLMACGTPWAGNEGLNTNTIMPLKSIVFMERSDKNSIERIAFSQAFIYLLQQTYIPKNVEKAKRVLALISSIGNKVSFYHFRCNNFSDDCFRVSYDALVKKTNVQ